jgi:integrase/recombinase XerD
MKDPSRVRVSGPLAQYAAGFAAELVAVGYRPASATIQLRLLAHLSRWLETEGLVPGGLGEAELERFRRQHLVRYASLRGAQGLVPLLGHLRGLGVVPPAKRPALTAAGELLERYRRYLTTERGLTAETAGGYVDTVRPFVESRVDAAGRLELRELSAADVLGFLLAESGRRSRKSAKLLVTSLRSLWASCTSRG